MIIIKSADSITAELKKIRTLNSLIGFVPTMGALHMGHMSLIKKSREVCGITVCSIFINPAQFNNPDDLKKYPVAMENDINLLEKNGCDILFLPAEKEIYPYGTEQIEHFDIGYLETILEGKYRPGHFQGVCNVVKRLLQIIEPTHLFMGQKDYQQCMVIKRLLVLIDSNIHLFICPTLREENGLAMSSRNLRLNMGEKDRASEIYKTLLFIGLKLSSLSLDKLKEEAIKNLEQKNLKVDYTEIANAENLEIINDLNGSKNVIALIAAYVNDVRLIDNILLAD